MGTRGDFVGATPLAWYDLIGWEHGWVAEPRYLDLVGMTNDVAKWNSFVGGSYLTPLGTSPLYSSASLYLNGRSSVYFGAPLDWALSSPNFAAIAQPYSIVMVASWNDNGITSSRLIAGDAEFGFADPDATGLFLSAGSVGMTSVPTHPPDRAGVAYGLYDGASSYGWLNGWASEVVDCGLDPITYIRVGGNNIPTAGFGGNVAFVGIYAGDVSADPNWSLFAGEAANRYGIVL